MSPIQTTKRGYKIANVPIIPNIAPLAPTAGIFELGANAKYAKLPRMPAKKKTARKFFGPIRDSKNVPNIKSANIFQKMWRKSPFGNMSACKNIDVTNVHGLEKAYAGVNESLRKLLCKIGERVPRIEIVTQSAIKITVNLGLYTRIYSIKSFLYYPLSN